MRRELSLARPLVPALALVCLGGCVSSAPNHVTYYAPANANGQMATLSAGDSLGWAVRSNDVILASGNAQEGETSSLANVPDDQD
ncbi:MAG: hypothetical protein ACF8GE_10385 [Phycisphaerales bacterium JB043]